MPYPNREYDQFQVVLHWNNLISYLFLLNRGEIFASCEMFDIPSSLQIPRDFNEVREQFNIAMKDHLAVLDQIMKDSLYFRPWKIDRQAWVVSLATSRPSRSTSATSTTFPRACRPSSTTWVKIEILDSKVTILKDIFIISGNWFARDCRCFPPSRVATWEGCSSGASSSDGRLISEPGFSSESG